VAKQKAKKPEPPKKVEKRQPTGAGLTLEGGRVLMDGFPAYLWEENGLKPLTSLKAAQGKTVWWREDGAFGKLHYQEL
jgi:hypothetical protein